MYELNLVYLLFCILFFIGKKEVKMSIVKSDKDGKAPIGFDKMAEGRHVVAPESFEMAEDKTTKQGKPLQYNTVFRDLMNPDVSTNSILLSTNFGHIKGVANFLTYLDKAGIAKKLAEQHPSRFPYDPKADHLEWDDDNFINKKDGKPVEVKQAFITSVRLAMKGATVGINVQFNEKTGFNEIIEWVSANSQPSSATAPSSKKDDSDWL